MKPVQIPVGLGEFVVSLGQHATGLIAFLAGGIAFLFGGGEVVLQGDNLRGGRQRVALIGEFTKPGGEPELRAGVPAVPPGRALWVEDAEPIQVTQEGWLDPEQLRGLTHRQRRELLVVELVKPGRTRILGHSGARLVRAATNMPAAQFAPHVVVTGPSIRPSLRVRGVRGVVPWRSRVIDASHPVPDC